jgi:hypothetical protein
MLPIIYNVYCDESCHLENDKQLAMVIGAVWCPKESVPAISQQIRGLKEHFVARGELKWGKVSRSREGFYLEVAKFFFKTGDLRFRCLVVDDKSKLNHDYFNQGSHDSFYYKMYFSMLKTILSPENQYNIYLDIKDTRSATKVNKLREVLCNNVHDFTRQMISRIQNMRSHESEILQLADFLIGAVSYRNRKLSDSCTKLAVAELISSLAHCNLTSSSPWREEKFNVFVFSPQEIQK